MDHLNDEAAFIEEILLLKQKVAGFMNRQMPQQQEEAKMQVERVILLFAESTHPLMAETVAKLKTTLERPLQKGQSEVARYEAVLKAADVLIIPEISMLNYQGTATRQYRLKSSG